MVASKRLAQAALLIALTMVETGGAAMFNPRAYENSRPGGIGVLEITNDSEIEPGQPRRFVPLRRTELTGEIAGPLAALRLTQVFGYSREQSDKVLEALYRFPLPGDAAVTGIRVRFGEVEIQAELKARQQAEADYEEARKQGRQAVLATRETPDVFTLQVAGIQPDQDVTVETSFVQLAKAAGNGWSLRVPLTTAPRYVRSDELTSRHARGQPLTLLRDPGHRFSLDVTVRGAASVKSATHPLDVTEEDGGVRLRLRDGETIPDRDCVLSWLPPQERDDPTLHVLLHDDRDAGQVYFLALVAPPAVHEPGHGVPREVVLLVDHSGSMEGPKWEAADWAVERFLSDLSGRDAVALGLFHDRTRWSSRVPLRADAEAADEAIRFLKKHRDSGGTELGVALEQALALERVDGARARHLLIVTDAQVSDEGRILRLADAEAELEHRRRISVLCIDAAPNAFLASELAARGGGASKFLTSDPAEDDITTALDEILADWAEPVLAGLRLGVNRPQVEAAGRAVSETDEAGWGVIDLGDLPHGRAVWVAGRVPRNGNADLEFHLTAAGDQNVAVSRVNLSGETDERPALKALFGARRIFGLEFLVHSGYSGRELRDQLERLGYDPAEVWPDQSAKPSKVYAENVRADAEDALRGLLVREALRYGLASSETGFVAVRTEAGERVEDTVVVANALPAGWSDEFLSQRSVAVSAVMHKLVAHPQAAFPMGGQAQGAAADIELEFAMEPPPSDGGPTATSAVVFSGIPRFADGEALLFDSSREAAVAELPGSATIDRLVVRFPDGTPPRSNLDRRLSLLIFVGDLAAPRASVRLVDLLRHGGERPLNLSKLPGDAVVIVLEDSAGAWADGAPRMEVVLEW